MHVIFVEPAFPANQQEFIRALHSVGAAVTAIGEAPVEALPRDGPPARLREDPGATRHGPLPGVGASPPGLGASPVAAPPAGAR